MKYFKPELLIRCRSRDDVVAELAAKEWEESITAYQAKFNAIAPKLPAEVSVLHSRFSLHDAKMLGVAYGQEKAIFGVLLQLEGSSGQPGKALELTYSPVAEPNSGVIISTHPTMQGVSRGNVWVLYDEFGLDEKNGFFTHSLLLTDGREIEVRFTQLDFLLLDEVVTPILLTDGERKWSVALTS